MSIETDRQNWKKLIDEVKDYCEKTGNTFDENKKNEVWEKISNKKLTYFLAMFNLDDGQVADTEADLVQWLMNDLYRTEDENKYEERIKNMIA